MCHIVTVSTAAGVHVMQFFERLIALGVMAAVLLPTAPALADEAYVCAGGVLVYVPLAELEAMKRSNACIASYYGLTVQPGAKAEAVSKPDNSGTSEAKSERPQLKVLKEPELETTGAVSAPSKVAVTAVRKAPPVAAPNTDFRHVHVINGGESTAKEFFHAR